MEMSKYMALLGIMAQLELKSVILQEEFQLALFRNRNRKNLFADRVHILATYNLLHL